VLGVSGASLQASAKPGGFGAKSGGGFKSGAMVKSGFKQGFHGKFGFHGKASFHGKWGKGFHHAHRFHRPRFAFGLPIMAFVQRPVVVVRKTETPQPTPEPTRIAEAKIYRVGTEGGCRSERVNVPQGVVTVWRC
jgi:hypothetical protein